MPAMNHTPLHEQLKMGIRQRVISGEFPPGSRLPGIRELAEQVGVNKNTVLRVYQELASDGMLDLRQGRGAYVRQIPSGGGAETTSAAEALTQALRLAKACGLKEAEVRRVIDECVGSIYRKDPRLAFVECHTYDAQALAGTLQTELGVKVDPVLLDDLLERPEGYFSQFDLVLTTFFHYAEVRQAAGSQQAFQVVGLDHTASVDSLKTLSSIPKGSVVGLVCKNQRTLDRLEKLISMYYTDGLVTCLLSESPRLHAMLQTCDVVVDHSESIQSIGGPTPRGKIITLGFQVTDQSLQYLRNRIAKLQAHP